MQLCGLRYELLDVLRELCDFLPESTDGLHEQLSECLGEWLDGQLGQVSGPCDGQASGVGLGGLQDVVQEGGRLDEQQDGWQCEELGGLGQRDGWEGWQLGGQGGGLQLVLEEEATLADDEGRVVRRT